MVLKNSHTIGIYSIDRCGGHTCKTGVPTYHFLSYSLE